VVGLIHPDPSKAKHMLEQFILYLRATLAETRAEKTTLAREFELMKNFLAVLQIRMGERLTVNLDLPADLHDYPIPPMLLQPLVENAIKHGLEPNINGGNLTLHAEQREHRLIIIIADTGVGFKGAHSAGIGLKNVRERLTQLYGDAARLHIEETHPAGTTVILNLPLAWKPLIKPTLTEDPKL
ncbi:MAG: histidine kinase, partial [Betaproteobacteria bacterium]|nr:histidine kinase [Betaproteobacteria bacterium]